MGWRHDAFTLDLRHAWRQLFRRPGLACAAGLSLAIGIGATTAAFSVVYAVLLRDLPVRDPDSLAVVRRNAGFTYSLPHRAYTFMREHDAIDDLVAFRDLPVAVAAGASADRVTGLFVSGNYFDVLGVPMHMGSPIGPGDDVVPGGGGPRGLVAVVSHEYWIRRLGGPADAVGRGLTIEGRPATIIGVAPAGFSGTRIGSLADVFVPIAFVQTVFRNPTALTNPRDNWLRIIARVAPGSSRAQAEARLDLAYQQFNRELVLPLLTSDVQRARLQASRLLLEPGAGGLLEMGPTIRPTLYSLMALVLLVLVIACLNVAGLLAARAERRHRDTAIARALGATTARLWRQHLVDALLVSTIGVGCGWVLAIWMRRLFVGLAPAGQQLDVSMDRTVFALSIALGAGATLLLGAISAWQSTRVDVVRSLKGEDLAARLRLRKMVIVGQLGLSVVVLLAAGLFVRTIANLRGVDPGFERQHLLIASIASNGRSADEQKRFFARLLDEVRAMPGVVAAATAGDEPLGVNTGWNISVARTSNEAPTAASASIGFVSPDYFRTMGIRVVRGREFETRDEGAAGAPIIVNENFVRRYLSGDPIGRIVRGNGEMTFEIIGVVRDSASIGLRDLDQHMIYVGGGRSVLHVRTAGDPAGLAPRIEQIVHRLDPAVPLFNVRTIDAHLERALERETTFARLSSAFAVFAAALSAVGLYGVMASAVARRRREIGIRLALGAEPANVVRLVVREGATLMVVAVALGVPAALATARIFASSLYGVVPADGVAATAAIAVIAIVALAATWAPARRASRVDPLIALRSE
jgi:predicted permease